MMDVLAPGGPQAAHIEQLWQLVLTVCSVVFALLMLVLAVALWRQPRGLPSDPPDLGRHARGVHRAVGLATGVSVALLLLLIAASILTDRALARLPVQDALHIELTGNMWWWDARYDSPVASQVFNTANELHVPVGRPVILTLKSADVIHSVWVPGLNGKKDLIPGRTAQVSLRADSPGRYGGRCAEFCGFQHAFMALEVVAEPPERFEAWATLQRQTQPEPADPVLARGRSLFLRSTCVMCHAVAGTPANARHAPDLTHVAGRSMIASGALLNTPENLRAWIRDPQQFKPGSNMPPSNLPEADLDAVAAWVGSLK